MALKRLSEELDFKINLKISKVLKNLGEKGRVNVINNYTVEQMCSKTLEIYKSLV